MSVALGTIDNRLLSFFTSVKREWANAEIISGYRTCKKQRELFLKLYGKRAVALPCFSSHNYGLAIDIVGIEWTTTNKWQMRQILKNHPEIKWGITFDDIPHFYVSGWRKIVLSRFASVHKLLLSSVVVILIAGIIKLKKEKTK